MVIRSCLLSLLLIMSSISLAETKNPDPWRGFNYKVFQFNEFFDKNILKPIAKGYKKVTPKIVNKGIVNFFSNLSEPRTFVNDLLQAKPKEAIVDFGRFGVNSTLGILGLFDVATKFNWHKNNEDLGQTLGKWGVPSGPFIVLPFLGPSTVRDSLSALPESYSDLNPLLWPDPHLDTIIGATAIRVVSIRAALLDSEALLIGDRYTALRDLSLQVREFSVKDGEVEDDFDSDEDW